VTKTVSFIASTPVDLAASAGHDLGPLEGEGQVVVGLALQEIFLAQNRIFEKRIVLVEMKLEFKVEVFVVLDPISKIFLRP
jgi:hypothetical protein